MKTTLQDIFFNLPISVTFPMVDRVEVIDDQPSEDGLEELDLDQRYYDDVELEPIFDVELESPSWPSRELLCEVVPDLQTIVTQSEIASLIHPDMLRIAICGAAIDIHRAASDLTWLESLARL